MKHLILLTLLLSCSPQGAPVQSEAPSTPDHAVEANIPSEGCACIKIFRPVCAEGRTFGNSCEAECHGHKEWSEGSCN